MNEESEVLPKRTRRVKMDYKQLNNPFLDNNKDENSMIAILLMINNESYNAIISNGPISLVEVKKSPDWPEWKKIINTSWNSSRTWVSENLSKSCLMPSL